MRLNWSPVPPITNPSGRHWDQPPATAIRFGQRFCHMSFKTFKALATYDTSVPTGTYNGKMWKRQRRDETGWLKIWDLCWYDTDPDPKYIAIKYRRICLTDDAPKEP